MKHNDIYWKGLIEDMFVHFIPFFLPQYAQLFDTDRPVAFLDKELQQLFPERTEEQEVRFVDKLVKVFTPSGEEKWVLVHIEVQGYTDPQFAERMFTYFYRIYDRYKKPVTAIAIYTDNNPAFCPTEYLYEFAGTQLPFRFNTYKVLRQDEKELGKSDNPFAIAILTVLLALKSKKLDDNNLLVLKLSLARQMKAKGFSSKTTRQLFNFIKVYVNFTKPETAEKYESEVNLITNNTDTTMGLEEQILDIREKQGIAKGIAKGITKGKTENQTLVVSNLLQLTDFSDEKIASLAGVTIEFIQKIRSRIR